MSATEIPEIVKLVFNMELLDISSVKLGVNTKFDIQRVFEQQKKSRKECDL